MILDRKTFVDAVSHALVGVAPRPDRPILSAVKLEASGGLFTISGFDLNTQATATFRCDHDFPLTLVNGDLLRQVVSKSKAKDMTLTTEGSRLQIGAGRAKVTLPTMPADDYPNPLQTPDSGFTIDGTAWDLLASSVTHAASKEESMVVLTTINFEVENGILTATATDRYRIAENSVSVTGNFEGSFMLDAKTVLDIQRHLDVGAEWNVKVNDAVVAVNDYNAQVIRSLIDGNYPQVSKLFPDSTEHNVTVDREALRDAINGASALLGKNEAIRFTFTNDVVTIEAGSEELGNMIDEVDIANYAGDGEIIQINPLYIADALAAVNTDEVIIGWTHPNKPISVSGVTEEGPNMEHRQLVMPIKL